MERNEMPTAEMQIYFDNLPGFVQETLMQASVRPATLDELRGCAENLLRQDHRVDPM